MKLLKFALFFALAPFTVHADDGGVVGISAHDLAVYDTSRDWNNGPRIDKPAFRANITGGEAHKLMSILPSDLNVLTAEFPAFAKTFNENFRTLEITAGKNQPTVTISCEGGELKFDSNGHHPTLTPYKDGVHCTVSVNPVYSDDDNVMYQFNPAKDVCKWFR
jgi:hypothetical protein